MADVSGAVECDIYLISMILIIIKHGVDCCNFWVSVLGYSDVRIVTMVMHQYLLSICLMEWLEGPSERLIRAYMIMLLVNAGLVVLNASSTVN